MTPCFWRSIHLLFILIALFAHHVEEAEFIDPLARRHHAQPVSELLLLEEFLGPGSDVIRIKPALL